jgi:hypothetical protein
MKLTDPVPPLAVAARFAFPLLVAFAVAFSALHTVSAQQTFTGIITDDMCAVTGHDKMRMGPTDAECTKLCVAAHGASYVLLDGKTIYILSDQKKPEAFAGQRVRVVGTLDTKAKAKTITVQSIAAAK